MREEGGSGASSLAGDRAGCRGLGQKFPVQGAECRGFGGERKNHYFEEKKKQMQTVWSMVSLTPDTPAASALHKGHHVLAAGDQHGERPQQEQGRPILQQGPLPVSLSSRVHSFPHPNPSQGRDGEEGLLHPELSLASVGAAGAGGGAIAVESWQRQPAAAGRVEKMISNPEKCRPGRMEGPSQPWEVRGRVEGRV